MTETDTRKPADSDTLQPPANRDRQTETGDRSVAASRTRESGGPKGLEPTRYGDWECNGRCTDF